MYQKIQDVTVVKYSYNAEGIYIEYHVLGDPREYHYMVDPENVKDVLYEAGIDPALHLSQYDAIILVWKHLNELAGKKISEYTREELIGKVCQIVVEHDKHEQNKAERHLNIHRNY
jgi:hypothetical protein